MTTDDLHFICQCRADEVTFLTEKWEKKLYAAALFQAKMWGYKKARENKEYFKKNHLIDKYNV